jgi:hypothetical protein
VHWPVADHISGKKSPDNLAFSVVKTVVLRDNIIKLTDILKELDGGSPLVGPGGTIKGGPTPKQVKKMRKKLDKQKEDELDEIDFHSQTSHVQQISPEEVKQNITLITNETEVSLDDEGEVEETVTKIGDKYVVYPKKGGKRLGTHSTKTAALKQLAAIEINKGK